MLVRVTSQFRQLLRVRGKSHEIQHWCGLPPMAGFPGTSPFWRCAVDSRAASTHAGSATFEPVQLRFLSLFRLFVTSTIPTPDGLARLLRRGPGGQVESAFSKHMRGLDAGHFVAGLQSRCKCSVDQAV